MYSIIKRLAARWHPVAVAVALFVASAFALANIPGNPIVGPDVLGNGKYGPHFLCGPGSVAHGWPMTFLTHGGHNPLDWLNPSPWRIGPNATARLHYLVVNICVALAAIIAAGWFVNRRLRTRGWQFTISELLALTACTALAIGYLAQRWHVHQSQIAFLRDAGSFDVTSAEWQPFGPHWLRELTGDRLWAWGDQLVGVYIGHSDDIAKIPGKRNIKVIRIQTVRCDAMPALDRFPNLLAIDMWGPDYDYSDVASDAEPELWPCLRAISECNSLEGLNLYEAGVTNRGLEELAGMANLKNLYLAGNLEVSDEGLVHLRSLNSLRYLGLTGTSVTTRGIEDLRRALPNCEIEWVDSEVPAKVPPG